MKKILLSLVAIMCIAVSACARDTYSRNTADLPKAAQAVLKSNFKGNVSLIKIDKDFGRISEYEVILTDGTEITFDNSGNWKEIEMRQNTSVPSKLIPQGIVSEVNRAQKGTKIIGIEKDRHGYDVTLSNGIEMKFNSQGVFQRYDD